MIFHLHYGLILWGWLHLLILSQTAPAAWETIATQNYLKTLCFFGHRKQLRWGSEKARIVGECMYWGITPRKWCHEELVNQYLSFLAPCWDNFEVCSIHRLPEISHNIGPSSTSWSWMQTLMTLLSSLTHLPTTSFSSLE